MVSDYSPCGVCGYDHAYEQAESQEAHREEAYKYMLGLYDESDPVMKSYGQNAWEDQVDRAFRELSGIWSLEREKEVERKLLSGHYAVFSM